MYQNYKPVHSDFIIHWTGKDIDSEFDKDWTKKHSSSTNPISTEKYLQRLKNILNHGLWMTEDPNDEFIRIKGKEIKRPIHSRTCFSELKLSMARSHAAEFGRLGIGFKRFFLFNRIGAPMFYFNDQSYNWFQLPLLDNNISGDDYYTCLFKSMTQKTEDSTLQYKFFDESEWRIIYSNSIKNKLVKIGLDEIISLFTDVENIKDKAFIDYCNNSKIKPKYLIPVKDKWFAMIIYPSIEVKVKAQSDNEIKNLINSFKKMYEPNTVNNMNNPASWEPYNYPVEINLDDCRNF
jgi:hypothetical protein